jgi:hypothetical protein
LIVFLVLVEFLQLRRREGNLVVRQTAELILRRFAARRNERMRVLDRRLGS